jgi:undecaprenyl diphosphate synthase
MNKVKHIAIVMDGNGRWAQAKGLNRTKGHSQGANVVRDITTYASNIGLEYLTLYAFSTENWKRPKLEVDFLMKLLEKWLKQELPLYIENNVRFETIGDLSKLPKSTQKMIKKTKEKTAHHTGLTQILAINYGAKDEIIRAIRSIDSAEDIENITEKKFDKLLDTKNIPAVDIFIRTGGDRRISNFLLWQIAYAEIFFLDKMWPDFTKNDLEDILKEFEMIERRFGGLK